MIREGVYQRKPTFINLNVTHRCNLKCVHCSIGQRPKSEVVDYNLDIKRLKLHLMRLKIWLKDFTLNISGGEPLLYPHLFELLDFCQKYRISIDLVTNGWFIDDAMASRLADIDFRNFSISIDGMPGTHDHIRNRDGSFVRAIEGAKRLHEMNPGLRISNSFTIMSHNVMEIRPFLDWFAAQSFLYNVSFQAISLFPLETKISPSNYVKHPLWPKKGINAAIDRIIRLKREGARIGNSVRQLEAMKNYFMNPVIACKVDADGCPVRYTSYFIEANDEVLICPMTHFNEFGRIGELSDSPELLWNGDKARATKQKMRDCRQVCQVYYNCCFDDKSLVRYPHICIVDLGRGRYDMDVWSVKHIQRLMDFLAISGADIHILLDTPGKNKLRTIEAFEQLGVAAKIHLDLTRKIDDSLRAKLSRFKAVKIDIQARTITGSEPSPSRTDKQKMENTLLIDGEGKLFLGERSFGTLSDDLETRWLSEEARTARREFGDSDSPFDKYRYLL